VLAIVPVKSLAAAKSRLAPALAPDVRAELVIRMLDAVVAACRNASAITDVLVVTPEPALARRAELLVDEGTGHGPALALALRDPRAREGALVVMADCPLATSDAVDRLAAAADPLALVASRDGGTNALALADPALLVPVFDVPGSLALTTVRARSSGIEPVILDEPSLAFDVDSPADLGQVPGLLAA
jgi:2-phospho-L-lactate guanylyltransferase